MNTNLTFQTSGSTSSSLLVRVRRHDAEAWERLTKVYGPLVYEWARGAHLQPEDAADIVQDVFHAVSKCIGAFDQDRESASFRAWLWGVTKNKLSDFFRRRATRPEATGGSDAQHQFEQLPECPPEDADEANQTVVKMQLVQRTLDLIQCELNQHTWQAFFSGQ